MALVEYTAEVRGGLLLELPAEAEELQLKPGDKVQVRLNRKVAATPMGRSGINGGNGAASAVQVAPKELRGLGMLAGILNSEDFMRRRREETEQEDRPIQ